MHHLLAEYLHSASRKWSAAPFGSVGVKQESVITCWMKHQRNSGIVREKATKIGFRFPEEIRVWLAGKPSAVLSTGVSLKSAHSWQNSHRESSRRRNTRWAFVLRIHLCCKWIHELLNVPTLFIPVFWPSAAQLWTKPDFSRTEFSSEILGFDPLLITQAAASVPVQNWRKMWRRCSGKENLWDLGQKSRELIGNRLDRGKETQELS